MTKPLYFYNGTTFEQVGPTTPQSPIAYQTSAPTGPATGDLWIDSDGDVDTYNRQLTRYYFVATAAQTTITGTDANGLTLAYVAGSEAVYVNGALQVRGQDYTATNGTSVVMSSALAVNDVVEIFAYTAFTVANAYTKSETDGIAAAAAGMRLIVPTSVSVGSGSASVDANGAVTFSGASTVTISNAFSANYDSYKILITGTSSTGNYLKLQLGATTTGYYDSLGYVSYTGSAGQVGESNVASFGYVGSGTTSHLAGNIDLTGPFLSQWTMVNAPYFDSTNAAQLTGFLANTTSYTGFTIIPTAGTITGTIRVYGYKD